MENSSSIILFIVVINGLVFLAMFAGVYYLSNKSSFFSRRPIAKAKSLIEQRLVLEAISACVSEHELSDVIKSIGKHAAEVTGYSEWMISLSDDDGHFRVVETMLENEIVDYKILQESHDPDLYAWILQNATPVFLDKFIADLAAEEPMRSTLSKFSQGLLIPFMDGEVILGYIILGGNLVTQEKRSDQFLSLFGAFAAIVIKKSKMDQQERILRHKQQRQHYLANLGQLAAGLAHEIRNPLTFIKAATQQLQRSYVFADNDKELTEGIVNEINRMNQHVEELLILGRIDPQKFDTVDVGEVVRKAVNLAQSKAEESGISIEQDFDHEKVNIQGSKDMLWQLILNLIINGIEATKQGGRIKIRSQKQGGFVSVDVEDTGHGIDPDIIDRIYDPFFTTKDRGTGLGLAIAFSVTQAHGGTLELLKSDSKGSCFRVRLPLAR